MGQRRGVAHDLLYLGDDERAFAAGFEVGRHLHVLGRAQLALDVVVQRLVAGMCHVRLPQHRAQLHARLENLALRGALADAEHLGNLFVLESFDVVQHERHAAPFGQAGDCAFDVDPGAGRLVRRGHVRAAFLEWARGSPHPALTAPQEIEALADCQPIQPRAERGVPSIAVELSMDLEKMSCSRSSLSCGDPVILRARA